MAAARMGFLPVAAHRKRAGAPRAPAAAQHQRPERHGRGDQGRGGARAPAPRGGGAAAAAAFIANPKAFEGPVAIVLSGGNIDPLLLERIMQTGLASAGRYLTVRIRIKDKPGSLAQLLTEIGGIGANILDVFHLRTDPMLALDEVAVNITMETRGTDHEKDVLTRIKALGHDAQVQ